MSHRFNVMDGGDSPPPWDDDTSSDGSSSFTEDDMPLFLKRNMRESKVKTGEPEVLVKRQKFTWNKEKQEYDVEDVWDFVPISKVRQQRQLDKQQQQQGSVFRPRVITETRETLKNVQAVKETTPSTKATTTPRIYTDSLDEEDEFWWQGYDQYPFGRGRSAFKPEYFLETGHDKLLDLCPFKTEAEASEANDWWRGFYIAARDWWWSYSKKQAAEQEINEVFCAGC